MTNRNIITAGCRQIPIALNQASKELKHSIDKAVKWKKICSEMRQASI